MTNLGQTIIAQKLEERLIEQAAINDVSDRLLDWLSDSDMVRSASIQELAARLDALRVRVERYFRQELALADALILNRGPTLQIVAARTRTANQRQAILARLNSVIGRIKSTMPGEEAWHEALYELGLITDAIDLYEDSTNDLASLAGHA